MVRDINIACSAAIPAIELSIVVHLNDCIEPLSPADLGNDIDRNK